MKFHKKTFLISEKFHILNPPIDVSVITIFNQWIGRRAEKFDYRITLADCGKKSLKTMNVMGMSKQQ